MPAKKKPSPRRRMSKHPGFEAEAKRISERENVPLPRARAILAARTREASKAAKAKNPRLRRVKG